MDILHSSGGTRYLLYIGPHTFTFDEIHPFNQFTDSLFHYSRTRRTLYMKILLQIDESCDCLINNPDALSQHTIYILNNTKEFLKEKYGSLYDPKEEYKTKVLCHGGY
jgi:hypothetical protein